MAGNRLAILAAAVLLSSFVVKSQDFTYEEQGDDWVGSTGLCSSGKSQSPIDIDTDDVVEVDSSDDLVEVVTSFVDFTATFAVKRGSPNFNNADSDDGMGTMTINGDEFKITNLNFNFPAEHLVDGKRYEAELHLYGKTTSGKEMMSAIFFEEGDENDFIQDILDSTVNAEAKTFNLDSIYDEGELDNYYYYMGSVNAPFPDCWENTAWIVMEEPLEMSSEQIAKLFELWDAAVDYESDGRYRHTQDLNGRKVYLYSEDDDDSSIYMAISSLLIAFLFI